MLLATVADEIAIYLYLFILMADVIAIWLSGRC